MRNCSLISLIRHFVIFLAVGVTFLTAARVSYAAILTLDPSSKSSPTSTTFDVVLYIDTEGQNVTSTDAVLNYDNSILEVTQIKEGGAGVEPFFPDLFQNIQPTEIYIGASVRNPTEVKEGTGAVATITFRGKIAGVTDVKFNCTPGKTSDTNISKSDKNATDIVDCSRLVNGRYTIGTGTGGPAPTAIPYLSPTPYIPPSATPTMPPTGSVETTMGILGTGLVLLFVGIVSTIVLAL